jgi:predicted transposase YdaD
MADLSSAHDSFVRAILPDRQVATDYFRTTLPEHLVQKLDFSTLQQQPCSYLSGELRWSISDVVYSCTIAGSQTKVEVCLLIEHKSYRDKYTPLQIGSYLYSGYLQQVKQGRKQLSPIIPVLFYHGKQKWEYHTTEELFGNLHEELLPYIPDFQYIYHNLRELPDEDLRALDNRFFLKV